MVVSGHDARIKSIHARFPMQYMLTLYSEEAGWNRMTEADQQQAVASYIAYTEALKNAGAWVASNRLQPTSTATTVRVSDGKSQVLDGPYSDSKEQIGGFYLIDVPDLDAALSWAARCPGASHGTIEVRPLWLAPVRSQLPTEQLTTA
jgi:hypothetical protein